MQERAIRHALLDRLKSWNHDPQTRIVEELGLCRGEARIDVAVVNGSLQGYEIKSPEDTFERLPQQADVYGRVFDSVALVTSEKQIQKALDIVPDWWGIFVVKSERNQTTLSVERSPNRNREQDPRAVVELLWKNEALDALALFDADKRFRHKNKREIWNALVDMTTRTQLGEIVRSKLKNRQGWRAV